MITRLAAETISMWRRLTVLILSGIWIPPTGIPQDSPPDIRLPGTPTYSITIEAHDFDGLALHDIDGDGFLDLFCACNDGGDDSRSMMFFSDKGRFKRPSWQSEDESCSAGVALADLDGDGDQDLILTRYNGGRAAAYHNLGKGQFEKTPFWTSEDDEVARHVIAGDFDGDGFQDILAADRIYRGSKAGPLAASHWQLADDPGYSISRMLWTEVDRDGIKDLVISNWMDSVAYRVYRGLKQDFEKTPSFEASRRGEFSGLAVGDIDGDAFPEIVVGASTFRGGDGRIRLYPNLKGKPAAEPSWMSDDLDCDTEEIELADFDKDGDLDLFVLANDHSAIYENRGGKLATQPCWRANIKGDVLRVADLDKNGHLDLVISDRSRLQFFMGAPGVGAGSPAKVVPFPPGPKLSALTRRDLLTDADPGMAALLREFRKERSTEVAAKLKGRAPAAMSAIEILGEGDLGPLAKELRQLASKEVEDLIARLSSDRASDREEATQKLMACGTFALPALDKASASEVPERASRARAAIDQIALQAPGAQAIDVLGMKLARLTPALKLRYGQTTVEGVVVLHAPDSVGPDLHLSNIREGDVLVGIGPWSDDGEKVDPVKSAQELVKLILKQDHLGKDPMRKHREGGDRGWRMAGYRYVCGPLHPTQVGRTREGRLNFTLPQWETLKQLAEAPRPWLPEK